MKDFEADKLWLGQVLYNAGVRTIFANMSGYGDSGDIDSIEYQDENDKPIDESVIRKTLEAIKLPKINRYQWMTNADDLWNSIVTEDGASAGDWWNNDGGSVSSQYDVREDGMEAVVIDFTRGEPEYDYDYDDDYDDV